ncbi:MAG: C40 family peptidase [Elusimicrobia bacterium]|nr:C40 family peptidase [Elusimicrobiota bacterium]
MGKFNVGLIAAVALCACSGVRAGSDEAEKKMFVVVPVADVRAKRTTHSKEYVQDQDQETQVIQGEPVLVKETSGEWARVECPQQPEFTHHDKWEGYPGWVELSALSSDPSREEPVVASTMTDSDLRRAFIDEASRHMGEPYLWGGRSYHDASYRRTVTGVDCSGLVNLSFRKLGIIVPRDAHEQFMKARRIEPNELRPGDLIFAAPKERADRVVHVAIYAGNGEIVEAPQSGQPVHRISIRDRFGMEATEMSNGMAIGDRVIYFGTLFES